jgi:hypothetical protein
LPDPDLPLSSLDVLREAIVSVLEEALDLVVRQTPAGAEEAFGNELGLAGRDLDALARAYAIVLRRNGG